MTKRGDERLAKVLGISESELKRLLAQIDQELEKRRALLRRAEEQAGEQLPLFNTFRDCLRGAWSSLSPEPDFTLLAGSFQLGEEVWEAVGSSLTESFSIIGEIIPSPVDPEAQKKLAEVRDLIAYHKIATKQRRGRTEKNPGKKEDPGLGLSVRASV